MPVQSASSRGGRATSSRSVSSGGACTAGHAPVQSGRCGPAGWDPLQRPPHGSPCKQVGASNNSRKCARIFCIYLQTLSSGTPPSASTHPRHTACPPCNNGRPARRLHAAPPLCANGSATLPPEQNLPAPLPQSSPASQLNPIPPLLASKGLEHMITVSACLRASSTPPRHPAHAWDRRT